MLTRGSTRILSHGFPKEMDSKFMTPKPFVILLWRHISINPNSSRLHVNYTSMVFWKWMVDPTKEPISILNLFEEIEKVAYRSDEISFKAIDDSRNNEPRIWTMLVVVELLVSWIKKGEEERPIWIMIVPVVEFFSPVTLLPWGTWQWVDHSPWCNHLFQVLHPLTIVESRSRRPWQFLTKSSIWLLMMMGLVTLLEGTVWNRYHHPHHHQPTRASIVVGCQRWSTRRTKNIWLLLLICHWSSSLSHPWEEEDIPGMMFRRTPWTTA